MSSEQAHRTASTHVSVPGGAALSGKGVDASSRMQTGAQWRRPIQGGFR